MNAALCRRCQKRFIPRAALTNVMKNKVAIAGFGEEGKALYEYFRKKFEVHVFSEEAEDGSFYAMKKSPGKIKNVPIFHRGLNIPADFETVFKSPGIPTAKLKLKSRKTKISSLTNLFFEKARGIIIGVTGTKGKSTTASLIYKILKDAGLDTVLIGNIGETGLKLLDDDYEGKIYVYELSSYQLEHLKKSPRIAVVTNIYQDHLSNHGGFLAYKKAKENITNYQNKNAYLVINAEIPAKDFLTSGYRINVEPGENFACKSKLVGKHNQLNILLAYSVGKIIDLPDKKILKSIADFEPLPGRLEKIATKRGITFYDDALATIPEATWSAIEALKKVDTIILGGQDRGINFEKLARQLVKTEIRNFIIFPQTGKKIVKYLAEKSNKITKGGNARRILPAKNMEEAVRFAYKYTKGICLLSTASPSFNMFKNYADRSQQYMYWISKSEIRISNVEAGNAFIFF